MILQAERILEPSLTRKEIVDIDILIIPRNDDRKIMQPIRITSEPAAKMSRWDQFSQLR